MMQEERHIKHFSCREKYNNFLKEKYSGKWVGRQIDHFFPGTPVSPEKKKKKDRQTQVIQTWEFVRHFLKNEQNEPTTSGETTFPCFVVVFITTCTCHWWWNLSFWTKTRILENLLPYLQKSQLPILKDFFLFLKNMYLFIYFWLCWVFIVAFFFPFSSGK